MGVASKDLRVERLAKSSFSEAELDLCRLACRDESFGPEGESVAAEEAVVGGEQEFENVDERDKKDKEPSEPPTDTESQSYGSGNSNVSARSASGSEAGDCQAQEKLALAVASSLAGEEGKALQAKAKHADTTEVWQYCGRSTVHFGHLERADRLACGKIRFPEVYERVPSEVEVPWPRCADCFLL